MEVVTAVRTAVGVSDAKLENNRAGLLLLAQRSYISLLRPMATKGLITAGSCLQRSNSAADQRFLPNRERGRLGHLDVRRWLGGRHY
jgi:hypothetical protein